MSVITGASKTQGQPVKTFDWQPKTQVEKTAEPAPEVQDPAKSKAQKMAQLKEQLLGLEKAERDKLLQALFAPDLQQIVKLEQQKGREQGLKEGQEQWHEKEKVLVKDLEQKQQELLAALESSVKTFADAKPVVEIVDERILVDIVYSAVLKIIDAQIAEGDYVREVIRNLAEEFSGQETLQLCLCSRDLHILNELNLQSLLPANMKVIEEDNLLPGSYRIHIEGGAIESKLDEKLKNFKTVLLDTYNRRAEEP